jgi:hypothetical protein
MTSRRLFVRGEAFLRRRCAGGARRLSKKESNDAHALLSVNDSHLVANTDRLAPTTLASFSPFLWLGGSMSLYRVAVRGNCRNGFARGHRESLLKKTRSHIGHLQPTYTTLGASRFMVKIATLTGEADLPEYAFQNYGAHQRSSGATIF